MPSPMSWIRPSVTSWTTATTADTTAKEGGAEQDHQPSTIIQSHPQGARYHPFTILMCSVPIRPTFAGCQQRLESEECNPLEHNRPFDANHPIAQGGGIPYLNCTMPTRHRPLSESNTNKSTHWRNQLDSICSAIQPGKVVACAGYFRD